MTAGSPAGSPVIKSIEQVCGKRVELMHRYSKLPDLSKVGHSTTVRTVPIARRPRVHNAQKRLGPAAIAQLVSDYQAGTSTTILAKSYGLGKGTILKLLDEAGVTRRRNIATEEQVNQAVELYAQSWSLVRIGEHLGFCQSAVWLWLKERGVVMRSSWERSNAGR